LISRFIQRGSGVNPDSDREAAIREGWVSVPNGPVDALID
jgi:hypothetical protein